jgi:LysR family transcriptional regulator, transcriptional activator of nhaA
MEWLNYHHLYYFWILQQEGSFTKAAKKLGISQSAVSEQVLLLEKNLDVRLLDRTHKKKLQITETGLSVLDYAQSIFETGQEMQRWLKTPNHKNTKRLRVGVQSGLSRSLQIEFLKPVIGQSEYNIQVTSGDQERILKLLDDYRIDVLLMSSALDERFSFEIQAHALTSTPICAVSSKPQKIKNINDLLKSAPLYLPSVHLEVRLQIDAYLERHKISPNIIGDIDDIALLRLLALSTEAIVLLPKHSIDSDLEKKELHILHEFKDIKKRYYAITRRRKFPNPLVEFLIRAIKKENK